MSRASLRALEVTVIRGDEEGVIWTSEEEHAMIGVRAILVSRLAPAITPERSIHELKDEKVLLLLEMLGGECVQNSTRS